MCAGSRFHCMIFSEKPAFQAFPIIPIFYPNFYLKSSNFLLTQAFKRALLFPTFWICSYFPLLFHENALLSILFFTIKCHVCVKKSRDFSLLAEAIYVNQFIFSGGTLQSISKFLLLPPNVSLFSLGYCHSNYPAYLV